MWTCSTQKGLSDELKPLWSQQDVAAKRPSSWRARRSLLGCPVMMVRSLFLVPRVRGRCWCWSQAPVAVRRETANSIHFLSCPCRGLQQAHCRVEDVPQPGGMDSRPKPMSWSWKRECQDTLVQWFGLSRRSSLAVSRFLILL